MHLRQIICFCMTGGAGAVIDLGSLYAYVELLGLPKQTGFLLSAATAMVFVFIANKFFTFRRHHDSMGTQAVRFFMVYIPATLLNALLASAILWLGAQYLVAKIIAIGVVAVMNYLLSHFFIFKQQKELV